MVAEARDVKVGHNGDGLELRERVQQHHHSLPPVPSHTATASAAAELDEFPSGRAKNIVQTIAGVCGNVLEWYDFAVFGYFSDVLGNVFFPHQNGDAAIVESFAVFGGAFLMRPLGGIIMGYIGDLYGRKRALEISIFLMAFPTFAMGCLPSYERVGWVAIVLLVLIRLLQGLSVGGQLMSSLVFTVERHPKEKWGLYGSYVLAAANFGTLLGGLVGYGMRATLSYDQLVSWGWRIPFLSGIVVSLSGFYLRRNVEEDHLPQDGLPDGAQPENPIRAAFSVKHRRALLSCCMVPTIWSGGFYLSFVWCAIFMKDMLEPPVPNAFAVNSASLFFGLCLLFPLAGILSDKYGRVRVMTVGGCGMAALGPVMIGWIGLSNAVLAFFAQFALGIFLSCWGAPMMAWLVESFPPEARLTACAIGYNVAQAIAGGSAPSLATLLFDKYGTIGPGLLLTGIASVALIGLRCVAPVHHDFDELREETSPPIAVAVPQHAYENADASKFTIGSCEDDGLPEEYTGSSSSPGTDTSGIELKEIT